MRILFLLVAVSLFSCSKKDSTPLSHQPPAIINISPINANVGTQVTITGTNFLSDVSENIVKFNGTASIVTQATNTSIITSVPLGATSGKITVTVNGLTAISTQDFIVIIPPAAPTITSFTPSSGQAGTEVIIKGTNFAANTLDNIVKFNGITANISHAVDTQLIVTVPVNATSGKISVTSHEQTAIGSEDFEILTGIWTQKADFDGGGRVRATGFSIGSKGYIFSGITTSTGTREKDFWEYDPQTTKWTRKADFPGTGREYTAAFSIEGKGYITTGYEHSLSYYAKDLWEYDPQTDHWTKKADFPGILREGAIAFTAGGKGYVGLGANFYTPPFDQNHKDILLNDLWEYNPIIDQWSQKADFPGSTGAYASSFSLNDKGYVGLVGTKEFWEYDPSNNQWTKKADFPGDARSHAIGFAIGGKGYMGFGFSNIVKKDFWEYDPLTNKWRQKADCSGAPRHDLIGFSINNRGFIGTGTPGDLKDFWEFTPQ